MLKKIFLYIIIIILCVLPSYNVLYAQHVVRTEDELCELLSEDKDQGIIMLDGDLFHIADIEVKAGAIVKPYPGRKPVLIGFHQKVTRDNRPLDKYDYWTVPIKSSGYSQIVFLDGNLESIPYSCRINEYEGYDIKSYQIKVLNRDKRLVRIPIPQGFEYLKNRNRTFLKNFSIKVGYWFVGMSLDHLYSDNDFLYGIIDSTYNLDLLSIRPNGKVRIEFFNIPIEGNGIFLDGNDVLHVPGQYEEVRICATPPILKLQGQREIMFNNLTFVGANGVAVAVQGSNKHFEKCFFRNCGSAIVTSNGSYYHCTVEKCLIENLYNNTAINLCNVNDAVVEGNTIRHTGTMMKGGSVVAVGGLNFKVKNNSITDYSYIAINASMTRNYRPGTMNGVICENLVDNIDNWGLADNQLTDGGGIYVLTHTDGVVIEDNIIRNIGYEGCNLWGIYLDDGAYNCTVRRNLVYNMWPGQYAMTARYVDDCERSCMNNVVERNIFIGPCVIAGNRGGHGEKTVIRNNYITGELNTRGDEYVTLEGNKFVSSTVGKDGRIVFGKGVKIKRSGYIRKIHKLIKR